MIQKRENVIKKYTGQRGVREVIVFRSERSTILERGPRFRSERSTI